MDFFGSNLATALAAVNPRVILSQVEQGVGAPQDGHPDSLTSRSSKAFLSFASFEVSLFSAAN